MSADRPKRRRFNPDRDVQEWKGRYVRYDIVKEGVVALVLVGLLMLVLAIVFSSPDERAITLKTWSNADAVDFAQTAITELDGTSGVATYGPPYNAGSVQHIGFFEPAQWFGVHIPIDTAHDFVIGPLKTLPNRPVLQAALDRYNAASPSQQSAWTSAYEKAVANTSSVHGRLRVPGVRTARWA